MIIYYEDKDELTVDSKPQFQLPKLTIEVPSPFAYKDSKAVPWNYTCNVTTKGSVNSLLNQTPIEMCTTAAVDITGTGGITRSGRCYTPEMLRKIQKGKAKEGESEENIKKNPSYR